MNHPTMTDRTSTTRTDEEMKKRAGAVIVLYTPFFFAIFSPYFHNPPHPYSAAIDR